MVGLPFYFGLLDGKYVIISHDIPIKSWLYCFSCLTMVKLS